MLSNFVLRNIELLLRSWADAKAAIEQIFPFDPAWLHLGMGVLIFLGAALVVRKPTSSWLPWLLVAILAALNEIVDVALDERSNTGIVYKESAGDFLVTIAIPTLLLIIWRNNRPIAESD